MRKKKHCQQISRNNPKKTVTLKQLSNFELWKICLISKNKFLRNQEKWNHAWQSQKDKKLIKTYKFLISCPYVLQVTSKYLQKITYLPGR